MLKAAANLTRDLNVPSARFIGPTCSARRCSVMRRCSRRCCAFDVGRGRRCGLVAVLALYRAGSFIHELTHIKKGAVQGLPLRLEPDRRRAAAGAELHVRRRPQPASRQALLRDGRRSRISAAGADAAVDVAGVPGRRRAGAGRHADPLRHSRAAVAVVGRSCARSWSAVIRACRSTRSSSGRRPKASSRATGRGRRAACSVWAIALLAMVATGIVPLRAFLIFLGVAVGRDVPQPGPHPGRASVGE